VLRLRHHRAEPITAFPLSQASPASPTPGPIRPSVAKTCRLSLPLKRATPRNRQDLDGLRMTLAKKPFKMPTMKQDRELAPSRRRQRRSGSSFRNACRSRFRSHLLRSQPLRKNPRTCCEGPFGEVLRATAPMAKVNPFRFSTKYQDDETDLLYYGYRYYSAGTGRWLNHDPLTDEAFARGLPFWAKRRFRRNATLVQDSMLTSSARQFSRTTLLRRR